MKHENVLYHGKIASTGVKVLEFPEYKIVDLPFGWEVICATYGNSGIQADEDNCLDWVDANVGKYVKLEDYEALAKRLDDLTKRTEAINYGSIESAVEFAEKFHALTAQC